VQYHPHTPTAAVRGIDQAMRMWRSRHGGSGVWRTRNDGLIRPTLFLNEARQMGWDRSEGVSMT
jgi:hypothetical protein